MKKLLFIFALAFGIGCSATATAQTAKAVNLNEEAVKNYDGIGGSFLYKLNERESLNVNYALTPKSPSNTAHFFIHTPDARPFSAKIADAKGKTVYTWQPQDQNYMYDADWDIASLKAGVYTVKVFMGKEAKSIHEFSFTKQ